jgi:hypothetical protein
MSERKLLKAVTCNSTNKIKLERKKEEQHLNAHFKMKVLQSSAWYYKLLMFLTEVTVVSLE